MGVAARLATLVGVVEGTGRVAVATGTVTGVTVASAAGGITPDRQALAAARNKVRKNAQKQILFISPVRSNEMERRRQPNRRFGARMRFQVAL